MCVHGWRGGTRRLGSALARTRVARPNSPAGGSPAAMRIVLPKSGPDVGRAWCFGRALAHFSTITAPKMIKRAQVGDRRSRCRRAGRGSDTDQPPRAAVGAGYAGARRSGHPRVPWLRRVPRGRWRVARPDAQPIDGAGPWQVVRPRPADVPESVRAARPASEASGTRPRPRRPG